MNQLRAEGIVIRSYDYGEGHRIVVLFTKELGKIKAAAKGSRKTRSKFAASLEPLSGNQFALFRKPASGIYSLTGVRLIDPYSGLREDMRLFGYGSLMLEAVDILCAEEDPDIDLYYLLLEALADLKNRNPSATAWLFFFRVLKLAGYRLNMFSCGECGRRPEGAVFSFDAGGVICRDCTPQTPFIEVSPAALESIRKLSPGSEISEDSEREIGNIIKKYIKYQLDRELNSTEFLDIFKKQCIFRT